MRSMKTCVVLLALLLVGMAIVPCVSATMDLTKQEVLKKVTINRFNPSKEFLEYMNAPSLTLDEKREAVKITGSSAAGLAGTQKKFGDYLNSSHGPMTILWAYPYSGDIYLSMTVGSPASDEYGLAYAIVNVDNATVLSEGFTDWHTYW